MPRSLAALLIGLVAFAELAQPARAEHIKVLTAGAMRGLLAKALPEFERTSGHKVALDNATVGALTKRIEDGERFDLAILTPVAIDALVAKGKIAPGSRADLAKVGIGVAVKAGRGKAWSARGGSGLRLTEAAGCRLNTQHSIDGALPAVIP